MENNKLPKNSIVTKKIQIGQGSKAGKSNLD